MKLQPGVGLPVLPLLVVLLVVKGRVCVLLQQQPGQQLQGGTSLAAPMPGSCAVRPRRLSRL